MATLTIQIPDDFQNELLVKKSATGISLRFQVLNALRKDWGWDDKMMPRDGRVKLSGEIVQLKFNGHSPGNIPLDKEGLPDFDAVFVSHDGIKPDEEF